MNSKHEENPHSSMLFISEALGETFRLRSKNNQLFTNEDEDPSAICLALT